VGYNSYEVRGSEVYPVISDDFEYYSLPMFEIEGDHVYPTVFNNRDDFGMPAFEIRDGWARACGSHAEDDFDFEVPQPDRDDEESEEQASGSSPEDPLWTMAGWAVGFGAAVYMARKQARIEAQAQGDDVATPAPMPSPAPAAPAWSSAPATPAGWYPTPGGWRFWNGMTWTGHIHPAPPGCGPPHDAPRPSSIPTTARGTGATVVAAWLLTVLTVGYMLPWAVAVTRRASNSTSVGLVCLLLGWTVIGWIVALVMACTGQSVPKVVREPFPPGR
jgi:hypothetical protein